MFNTLQEIDVRKAELAKQIQEQENLIASKWDSLFHPEPESLIPSPTQRIIKYAKVGSMAIDGALLGWKLYHKFGGKKNRRNR